jgi:very-short-patch-repair endonuclease
MGPKTLQPRSRGVWELAHEQHGVVARVQLIELGMNKDAIQHRIERGRLHRLWRGVYAVGRPDVGERGRWLGAVLSCGSTAALSHRSAAALWGIRPPRTTTVEVVVPGHIYRRRAGIVVHRQTHFEREKCRTVDSIPVTDPASTLVDLASCATREQLEIAVNEADRLDLIDPESLREAIEPLPPRPGLGKLRTLLDRQTFTLTDSPLERRFLPLARAAGLPAPETQARVNGFRVDFYWPQLGLVVETDGLRYHRTAAQQAKDRRRDQVHAAAGLTTLRFSAAQINFEVSEVRATLAAVAERLSRSAG